MAAWWILAVGFACGRGAESVGDDGGGGDGGGDDTGDEDGGVEDGGVGDGGSGGPHDGVDCGGDAPEPSITQGLHGTACWTSDQDSNRDGPIGPMRFADVRGTRAEVELPDHGAFEFEADPGRHVLCELGYLSCVPVDLGEGLTRCDAQVAPPPVSWSGACDDGWDWAFYTFELVLMFAFDPDNGTGGSARFGEDEVRPTLVMWINYDEYHYDDNGSWCSLEFVPQDDLLVFESWVWEDDAPQAAGSFEHRGFQFTDSEYDVTSTCPDEDWVDEVITAVQAQGMGMGFGNSSAAMEAVFDEYVTDADRPYYFGSSTAWTAFEETGGPPYLGNGYALAWALEESKDGLPTILDAEPLVLGKDAQVGARAWYELYSYGDLWSVFLLED